MLNTLKSVALALVCLAVATVATAATPTTNYGWQKPGVGADADQWGTYINADLDGIDSIMKSVSDIANGACPKTGCTFTGGITANTGVVSLTTVDALTPNLSTTGGYRLRGNATSGLAYLQITDSAAGSEWGNFKFQAGAGDTGTALWTGGLFTFGGGIAGALTGNASSATKLQTARNINVSGGDISCTAQAFDGSAAITIGGCAIQAGVVNNSKLDTVFGAPGSCGSATVVCPITVNAQGRITAVSAVTIQPDTCGSNANGYYCKNAEGYIHEWGLTSVSVGSGGGQVTQTLPLACPTSVAYGQVTTTISGTNGAHVMTPLSQTSLTLRNDMGNTQQLLWTADCN